MPFQHRGSPAANADAAGHGGRAPVRPGQRLAFPRPPCRRRACSQAERSLSGSFGPGAARDLPAEMHMARFARAKDTQSMQEFFPVPL